MYKVNIQRKCRKEMYKGNVQRKYTKEIYKGNVQCGNVQRGFKSENIQNYGIFIAAIKFFKENHIGVQGGF